MSDNTKSPKLLRRIKIPIIRRNSSHSDESEIETINHSPVMRSPGPVLESKDNKDKSRGSPLFMLVKVCTHISVETTVFNIRKILSHRSFYAVMKAL